MRSVMAMGRLINSLPLRNHAPNLSPERPRPWARNHNPARVRRYEGPALASNILVPGRPLVICPIAECRHLLGRRACRAVAEARAAQPRRLGAEMLAQTPLHRCFWCRRAWRLHKASCASGLAYWGGSGHDRVCFLITSFGPFDWGLLDPCCAMLQSISRIVNLPIMCPIIIMYKQTPMPARLFAPR